MLVCHQHSAKGKSVVKTIEINCDKPSYFFESLTLTVLFVRYSKVHNLTGSTALLRKHSDLLYLKKEKRKKKKHLNLLSSGEQHHLLMASNHLKMYNPILNNTCVEPLYLIMSSKEVNPPPKKRKSNWGGIERTPLKTRSGSHVSSCTDRSDLRCKCNLCKITLRQHTEQFSGIC